MTSYRVRCSKTKSGWAWDVSKIKFFSGAEQIYPDSVIDSGFACEGYESSNALCENGCGLWGARPDSSGQFWAGGEFPPGINITSFEVEEPGGDHSAVRGSTCLEKLKNGKWVAVEQSAAKSGGNKPGSADSASKYCTAYRVVGESKSNWAWDVASVSFYTNSGRVWPQRALESGSAGGSYSAKNCILKGCNSACIWGGRQDNSSLTWIGGEFPLGTDITKVKILEDPDSDNSSIPGTVKFQVRTGSGRWKDVTDKPFIRNEDFVDDDDAEEQSDKETEVEPLKGPVTPASKLITRPSQPLRGEVPDVCRKDELHPPRESPFSPDPSFYLSENCEGLWVCVSKACGEETLFRACELVRKLIPESQREMWGKFRSPLWAKDPGPMRIIVLDNRTDEQAGTIPELQDDSKGRNGTGCPFVFTSREDFHGGVTSWQEFALTAHEATHGAHMVILQLIDPYFFFEVKDSWAENKEKFRYTHKGRRKTVITGDGEQTVDAKSCSKLCYAAENDAEYLAECLTIATGLQLGIDTYKACGLSTPEDLREKIPDIWNILESKFNLESLS